MNKAEYRYWRSIARSKPIPATECGQTEMDLAQDYGNAILHDWFGIADNYELTDEALNQAGEWGDELGCCDLCNDANDYWMLVNEFPAMREQYDDGLFMRALKMYCQGAPELQLAQLFNVYTVN